MDNQANDQVRLALLETADDMREIEDLQRVVWPDSETDIVPLHMIITLAHNGGLVIGAFVEKVMVGFVYGFSGITTIDETEIIKHCSHQMGVHPKYRDQGIGFLLKRAQWQLIRNKGIDLITWTYDPMLSKNAFLNINKLGSICNTYIPNLYGELRDGLNAGLPTDRFQVDWWVNSTRVQRRLSDNKRSQLDLAHYLSAGVEIINPSAINKDQLIEPSVLKDLPEELHQDTRPPLLLVEIPSDYLELKKQNLEIAIEWKMQIRFIFSELFNLGYIVTDLVYLPGKNPRSFYVVSHGDSTI